MRVRQSTFQAALLSPEAPVPEGLTDGQGRPAGRRFAVYRNNVASSLTEALSLSFPAIAKLIGAENFRKLAGIFLRRYPPDVPMLSHYGARMPAFLEDFAPLAHLRYLPDVARLEQAIRISYHAADAAPADPSLLRSLPQEALGGVRLRLVPALRLVRSRWPVHAIWAFNLENGPKPVPGPQNTLILRPGYDPLLSVIPDGAAVFIAEIQADKTLGEAHDAALAAQPDFDLSACLGLLLANQAIAEIMPEPTA